MIKKNKQNEKGFVLPLALLVLVVMSIMAATLVTTTSRDHAANNSKDSSQQAFYTAESGIIEAKRYLIGEASLTPANPPNTSFCKTSYFPTLKGTVKSINNKVGKENLNDLIDGSTNENDRLAKYSFEYFITYTPDKNGSTSSSTKNGSGLIYYTIFSCGCNQEKNTCNPENNIIIPLEAVVTLIK